MTLAELPLRDGPRIPPLAAFGPDQPNLVSVGSLSKLYWGGLRTGWIRGSGGLIARLAAAKAAADQGSTAFQQAIVAALLRGQHEDIVKWRGEWLRTRYDALAGALRASLPELDLARAGRRAVPVGAAARRGRQQRVRPGRAQARRRRRARPPARERQHRGPAALRAPGLHPAAGRAPVRGPQRWPLYQRRPDEPVPGHQGGQLVGVEPSVPAGRAGSTM